MSQYLSPLFGEFLTDQAFSRASAQKQGWLVLPDIIFGGNAAARTVTFTPKVGPGFCAWKTMWLPTQGDFNILEDAAVTVDLGADSTNAGWHKSVLVLGAWVHVDGATDSKGHPTGLQTAEMSAVYTIAEGTATAGYPADPALTMPDVNGRYFTVLGRAILTNGASPQWQWASSATELNDLSDRSTQTGQEIMWPVAFPAPEGGYLLENGASYLIADHPLLAAILRPTYGGEDGAHFFVPNRTGRFPLGVSGSHAIATSGGVETVTLDIDHIPPHAHWLNMGGATISNHMDGAGSEIPLEIASDTGYAGGGQAFSVLNPYLTTYFFIKT